jgi:hypothetical protein
MELDIVPRVAMTTAADLAANKLSEDRAPLSQIKFEVRVWTQHLSSLFGKAEDRKQAPGVVAHICPDMLVSEVILTSLAKLCRSPP